MHKKTNCSEILNRQAHYKVSRSAPTCLANCERRTSNSACTKYRRTNENSQFSLSQHEYSSQEAGKKYYHHAYPYYPENYHHSHRPEKEKLSRIDSIRKSLGRICVAWRLCVLPPDSDSESYHKFPYPVYSYSEPNNKSHKHSHRHCCHSDGHRKDVESDKHILNEQKAETEEDEKKSSHFDHPWEIPKEISKGVYRATVVKKDIEEDFLKEGPKNKSRMGGGEKEAAVISHHTMGNKTERRSRKRKSTKANHRGKKTKKKRKKHKSFFAWLFKKKKKAKKKVRIKNVMFSSTSSSSKSANSFHLHAKSNQCGHTYSDSYTVL